MTLLDKMAEVIRAVTYENAEVADHVHEAAARRAAEKALRSILTPTQSMVNRMGARALSGPQPEAGYSIYPGEMWKAGVQFILEEQDREPEGEEPEAASEVETET